MYSDGKVYATFNNVTIGIDAVIFVEIYETALADASTNLVYKGNSSVFTVQKGENTVGVDLKKVQNQEVTQKFTVTFDANGGSFESGSQTQQVEVQANTPVTEPEEKPSSGDKTFEFWTTRQDDGNFSQYDFSQPVTADLTLYAQWRAPNQVASVKFDPATSTVDYNTEITLSCDTADATIYYTTDGSDPTTSSNVYQTTPITITQETTIKAYAVKSGMTDSTITEITYSLNQYTVQFELNGGSFTDGKTNSLTVTSGNSVDLNTYQPQYAGYTFGGWYFDEECNNPVDDSGIVTPIQANITLYAKWEVVNNSITTLEALQSAITSASETIHVAGDFNISTTLTISSATTIIADAPTTFTRASGLTGALFTNSADLILQGSENAIITIDGNDIEATEPAIQSTANLTLTYCNFENNTNTGTDGGAVFVETNSEVTLTASNCNFTDNKVTGSIKAGGAVAINGTTSSSSFTNCTFTSNVADASDPNEEAYGGAVYINGDTSAYSGKWHEFTSCTFTSNSCVASKNYGGAMYFMRGSFSLNNVTMQNNKWGTETANANSDIFADTSAVNLKLAGLVQIDSLLMKTLPKNLAIGDSFQTSSKIPISIDSSSPTSLFKVLSYDKIGINNTETKSLSPEQIACFAPIVDSSGKQYTLNANGTISTQ